MNNILAALPPPAAAPRDKGYYYDLRRPRYVRMTVANKVRRADHAGEGVRASERTHQITYMGGYTDLE